MRKKVSRTIYFANEMFYYVMASLFRYYAFFPSEKIANVKTKTLFGIHSHSRLRNSAFSPNRGSGSDVQRSGIMSFGIESVNRIR